MIIRDTETRRDEWRRSVLLMLAQRYLFGFLVFVVLFSGVELFRHSASAAAHALPWLPISRQPEVKQKPAQVLPASTPAEAQQKALQTMQEEIITLKLWVVDEAIKILGIVFAVVSIVTTLLGVGGVVWAKNYIERTVNNETSRTRLELIYRADVKQAAEDYNRNRSIEDAIANTKRALDSRCLSPMFQVVAKTNLAYYYAYQGHIENKERALQLAKESVEEGINELRYKLVALLVNQGYVKLKFATGFSERRTAREFLLSIRSRRDCLPTDEAEIDKYLSGDS